MLAWGKRVSSLFRDRVIQIGDRLQVDPNYLMACMSFETGRTFSPSVRNSAGSGAVGLIQFMPSTAQALGTHTLQLASMSAVSQLGYVERYFLPRTGRLRTLEDVYMAILWPSAIAKPNSYVLFARSDPKNPTRYVQNAGLDYNKDGLITKGEAAGRVRRELEHGLAPGNVWP